MTHMVRKRTLSLVTAIAVAVGSINVAHADQPANSENAWSEQDVNDLEQALGEISPDATPEDIADHLFPDDPHAREEIVSQLEELEAQAFEEQTQTGFRALPAALVPFVPIIGKCVVGALGGTVVGEIVHLWLNGEQNDAKARVEAAISGCLTGVLPGPLKALGEKMKPALVDAVLAIILHWHT